MKIGYYLGRLTLTGGTKVIDQHLRHLADLGLEPFLFAKRVETDWAFAVRPTIIESARDMAGRVDAVVATRLGDLGECLGRGMPFPVMFSQRSELDDLAAYYDEKRKLAKYDNAPGRLFLASKHALQRLGIRRAYRNRAAKWTPSHTMALEFARLHRQEHSFIRNAVNLDLYRSAPRTRGGVPTILCVGDARLGRKNVPLVYAALERIRQRHSFRLIRVSPTVVHPDELALGLIDEHHEHVGDAAMAALYAKADILISPSLSEGFGMPAIEGMASGCLCLLSDIPAYRLFHTVLAEPPGPYALYFDPHSAEDLARALDHALGALPSLDRIVASGRVVAEAYSVNLQRDDLRAALKKLPV